MKKNNPLFSRLGHTFSDTNLFNLALTHRSANKENNERLEFLGDSLLNFIITDQLFKAYPSLREGKLTRLRATLVRGDTLAELAKEMGLGDHLRLGEGELKSGGFNRSSILADAVEALIGAIYLDAGFDVCQKCVLGWFASRLENLLSSEVSTKDPKTLLQELLQQRKLKLPEYNVVESSGEAHNHVFSVECRVEGVAETTIAQGTSKKIAEKKAARKMLAALGVLADDVAGDA